MDRAHLALSMSFPDRAAKIGAAHMRQNRPTILHQLVLGHGCVSVQVHADVDLPVPDVPQVLQVPVR